MTSDLTNQYPYIFWTLGAILIIVYVVAHFPRKFTGPVTKNERDAIKKRKLDWLGIVFLLLSFVVLLLLLTFLLPLRTPCVIVLNSRALQTLENKFTFTSVWSSRIKEKNVLDLGKLVDAVLQKVNSAESWTAPTSQNREKIRKLVLNEIISWKPHGRFSHWDNHQDHDTYTPSVGNSALPQWLIETVEISLLEWAVSHYKVQEIHIASGPAYGSNDSWPLAKAMLLDRLDLPDTAFNIGNLRKNQTTRVWAASLRETRPNEELHLYFLVQAFNETELREIKIVDEEGNFLWSGVAPHASPSSTTLKSFPITDLNCINKLKNYPGLLFLECQICVTPFSEPSQYASTPVAFTGNRAITLLVPDATLRAKLDAWKADHREYAFIELNAVPVTESVSLTISNVDDRQIVVLGNSRVPTHTTSMPVSEGTSRGISIRGNTSDSLYNIPLFPRKKEPYKSIDDNQFFTIEYALTATNLTPPIFPRAFDDCRQTVIGLSKDSESLVIDFGYNLDEIYSDSTITQSFFKAIFDGVVTLLESKNSSNESSSPSFISSASVLDRTDMYQKTLWNRSMMILVLGAYFFLMAWRLKPA